MREAAFCLLIGFAALAGAAGEDPKAPGAGSRWEYEVRDQRFPGRRQTFRVEAIAVEGSVLRELLFAEGGEVSSAEIDRTSLRFNLRPLRAGASLVELSPYWASADETSRAVGYPGGLAVFWQISAPSYAEERVTVPAGTFATLRMELRGNAPAFGQGTTGVGHVPTRFVYTIWYSGEAGRYVRLRHQTWNRWNQPIGDEVVQLLGYQRGK